MTAPPNGKKREWRAIFTGRRSERFGPQRRRPLLLSTIFLGFCLIGLALLHVWVRLQVVRLGYVLSATSKLQEKLEQENRELKLELATLTSPERLEEMARVRLGLKEPEKDKVVILP